MFCKGMYLYFEPFFPNWFYVKTIGKMPLWGVNFFLLEICIGYKNSSILGWFKIVMIPLWQSTPQNSQH
jgi:hypothetical protein